MPCVSDAIITPAFFVDADARLASVPTSDTLAFCETLHALCAGLTLTDAFNVAFWSEKDQTLHYPYNFDEGVMDAPVIWSLGDGPTSWVISMQENAGTNPRRKAALPAIGLLGSQSKALRFQCSPADARPERRI